MLLIAAALTSGALGGVAEAFGVHENSVDRPAITEFVTRTVADPLGSDAAPPDLAPAAPSLISAVFTPTRSTPVDSVSLSHLSGAALLQQLGTLPTSDLAEFVKDNPTAVRKLVTSPPKATTVDAWWTGLGTSAQKSFASAAPEVVGNLEGVPFTVRDQANRSYLSTSIAKAKAAVSVGIGRAKVLTERHHLVILQQIERTLKTTKNEPPRQLLTFDPSGDGRAAVVVGDLSTANYVSYLVPGMFFTVQGQIYDWTVIAQDLYAEQNGWIKQLAKTDPSYVGKTTATVAWIGYSTPGVLDITSLKRADQGADYIGSAVAGVHAVRTGAEPFVTLVTHSYGSTAAMIELAKGGVSVDALAIVGSPGSAAQSASALSVKHDNVYVGEAAWDPIVNTAFYGSDPGSASFGAHKMDVAGGTDPITGKPLAAAIGHLGYFDAGTEAMRNLALIGLNQGELVSDGSLADASRTLK